ncbi:MAG: FAD-dependent oxidoreductase [Coriobacteriia bacterium]|nr:FAD-dependent oxidoreductase [Coriobacteriia bacterium]
MTVHNNDIAIIGGGASGLAAAIVAVERGRNVTIFESDDDIGHSILKTGNGRCNYSKLNINSNKYYNNKFVEKVFSQVSPKDVWKFFEDLGLLTYIDDEGRMFPYTKKASTIVDILKTRIQSLNINVITKTQINNLEEIKGKFNKVIICCGKHLDKLANDVHFQKLLCPIMTEEKQTKKLDGIKVQAKCSLVNSNNNVITSETGEILFREYGLSGICIFNLSRYVEKNQKIEIDFFPHDTKKELITLLQNKFKTFNQKEVLTSHLLNGILLPKISNTIFNNKTTKFNEISSTINKLKKYQLTVKALNPESQYQICRGGIKPALISHKTLKFKENIYVTGEAIDVDGPCGGYNLHWAWTTGILAGKSV